MLPYPAASYIPGLSVVYAGGWDSDGCIIITLPAHLPSKPLNIEELVITVNYLVTLPRLVIYWAPQCAWS